MNKELNVGFYRGIRLTNILKCVIFLTLLLVIFGFTCEKPRILIIGDSISEGYFPYVKQALKDKAFVEHNAGNAQDTWHGLKNLEQWLGKSKWDVVYFNWGLWDLCHRSINDSGVLVKDVNGKVSATPNQYWQNLDSLVTILEKTGAKLVFATLTYIPDGAAGRISGDELVYNQIAVGVMKKHNIPVNDLCGLSKSVHIKHGKAPGNVHYTAEGYEKIAEAVIDMLNEVLTKRFN